MYRSPKKNITFLLISIIKVYNKYLYFTLMKLTDVLIMNKLIIWNVRLPNTIYHIPWKVVQLLRLFSNRVSIKNNMKRISSLVSMRVNKTMKIIFVFVLYYLRHKCYVSASKTAWNRALSNSQAFSFLFTSICKGDTTK